MRFDGCFRIGGKNFSNARAGPTPAFVDALHYMWKPIDRLQMSEKKPKSKLFSGDYPASQQITAGNDIAALTLNSRWS